MTIRIAMNKVGYNLNIIDAGRNDTMSFKVYEEMTKCFNYQSFYITLPNSDTIRSDNTQKSWINMKIVYTTSESSSRELSIIRKQPKGKNLQDINHLEPVSLSSFSSIDLTIVISQRKLRRM
jgi:hypothetical protein